jgi:restriction endonuclease Mrr
LSDIDAERTRDAIKKLLDEGAKTKGPAFEDLVAGVLEAIPGLRMVGRRQRNVTNTAEIDLDFRATSECPLTFFGPVVLVECKNQKTKVGSPAVDHFAKKLREARVPGGILVTLSGISGSAKSATGAVAALDDARQEGQVIVVLERSELEATSSGDLLAAALQAKFLDMQVYGRHKVVASSDLRESGVKVLRGTDAIRRAIREQRRAIVDEVLQRIEVLPPSAAAGADTISVCLSALAVEAARAQDDPDRWFLGVRGALIALGRACVAQLPLLDPDFESEAIVKGNISLHVPENLDIPVEGGLWRAMTAQFVEQASNASDARALDATLTILGMVVDRIARIDDYVPEPEIWSIDMEEHGGQ